VSEQDIISSFHGLNRRIALDPQHARELYQEWFQAQLDANNTLATIHFALALDRVMNALGTADNPRTEKCLVLLVHGIRTQAEWQPMVIRALAGEQFTIIPIKYEYFDAIRFWCPILTRKKILDKVLWKIREAKAQHPDAALTIIAHSFGTYAVHHLLNHHPDIRCKRLILCGGIIPRDFRWDRLPHRPDIINECGSRDIWPIMAECMTWGYGASGVFGFGTPGIIDRFHDIDHSDYLKREFVEKFWRPWVHDGTMTPSDYENTLPPTALWRSLLTLLPLRWVVLVLFIAVMCAIAYLACWSVLFLTNSISQL
jgi:pimeloyl-ACP methyl ester carboxylesterase